MSGKFDQFISFISYFIWHTLPVFILVGLFIAFWVVTQRIYFPDLLSLNILGLVTALLLLGLSALNEQYKLPFYMIVINLVVGIGVGYYVACEVEAILLNMYELHI